MREELNPMTITVVLPQQIVDDMMPSRGSPSKRQACCLPASSSPTENDIRLLARKCNGFPKLISASRRGPPVHRLQGYVPFLAEAETLGAVAIWVHTHPGMESPPRPSEHDWEVDGRLPNFSA